MTRAAIGGRLVVTMTAMTVKKMNASGRGELDIANTGDRGRMRLRKRGERGKTARGRGADTKPTRRGRRGGGGGGRGKERERIMVENPEMVEKEGTANPGNPEITVIEIERGTGMTNEEVIESTDRETVQESLTDLIDLTGRQSHEMSPPSRSSLGKRRRLSESAETARCARKREKRRDCEMRGST